MKALEAYTRSKILYEIRNCAEMENYFHSKVLRTPIEDCEDDLKIELHYTKKLKEAVKIAKEMGISQKNIDDAISDGWYEACETVKEADDNGWWDY